MFSSKAESQALIPPNPSSPYNEQPNDVEEQRRRDLIKYQIQMLPLLSLPLCLTAFLAYRLSHMLGPAWFALHPTGELSALIAMVCAVIAGKYEVTSPVSEWKQIGYAVMAWLFALGGFIVIFTVKQQYQLPHFRSVHSHFGLLSFLAIMSYTIVSVVVFNPIFGKRRINPRAQEVHSNVGRLIVLAGLLTACLGILELEPHTIPNGIAWAGSLTAFIPLIF